MKLQSVLRVVAGIVCVHSVAVGVCLNGPESLVAGMAAAFLDYRSPLEPSTLLAARMLGAYMTFFGLAMGLVAWDPIRHRALLTLAALLLVARAGQRLAHLDELRTVFGISDAKNWSYMATMLIMAAACAVFRIWLLKNSAPEKRA